MAYLTTAALGANLVAGIYGASQDAAGYQNIGQITAAGQRYQAAVNANQILVQAENTARSAESQAQADTFNAKLSDQLATSAEVKAGAEAHDFRRSMFARLATSRAGAAASGLALEGSPLAVDENAFAQIEFGTSRIVYGGMLEASRFRNQRVQLEAEAARQTESARLARETGKKSADYALGAGEFAAAGSLAAADAKSASARSTGWSSSLSTVAKLGTTLSTRPVLWT